jgi:hypothetical protein
LRRRGSMALALAMTVSLSLVQVDGRQRSFQASMKRSMAAMRSATVGNIAQHPSSLPARDRRRVPLVGCPRHGELASRRQRRRNLSSVAPTEMDGGAYVKARAFAPSTDRTTAPTSVRPSCAAARTTTWCPTRASSTCTAQHEWGRGQHLASVPAERIRIAD